MVQQKKLTMQCHVTSEREKERVTGQGYKAARRREIELQGVPSPDERVGYRGNMPELPVAPAHAGNVGSERASERRGDRRPAAPF